MGFIIGVYLLTISIVFLILLIVRKKFVYAYKNIVEKKYFYLIMFLIFLLMGFYFHYRILVMNKLNAFAGDIEPILLNYKLENNKYPDDINNLINSEAYKRYNINIWPLKPNFGYVRVNALDLK